MIIENTPKYQMLKNFLIDEISSGKLASDEQIYSENELAEKFNISRHTVRKAIGELENDGWLYRVQGKGTFVRKNPGKKYDSKKSIGVITTYLNDYIFPSIIRGIDGILSESGYSITLGCTYNQHSKERACLESIINQNIGGLIVEPTKSALPNPNIYLYERLIKMNIPILFIHGCYRELSLPYIVEDDKKAGYIATKHLIGLGHKRIGGIFKIDDIQGHLRFSGFQNACQESGLKFSDSQIMWFDTDDLESKFSLNEGYIQNLVDNCTAIVCYNDKIALKVLDYLRYKKLKVPKDISLVSFDDSAFAMASEVKLTTVTHPKEKLGEEAAKAIINMINNSKEPCNLKMEPKLIIRSSTQKLMGGK